MARPPVPDRAQAHRDLVASTSRGRSSRRLDLARYAAAGVVGGHMALGSLAMVRDLAGLTGTGLAVITLRGAVESSRD